LPPEQRFEQQSPLTLQVLPAVLHDVLRAAHLPPVHVPLQHAAPDEQVAPSDVHAAVAHLPPTQLRLQHCVAAVQVAPAEAQAPVLAAHVRVLPSQSCEQQSAPVLQTAPNW
jgi:hypothetical protein